MNKLLTLIFALVMLLPLSAEKAVYNDINYTIDPITLTAEVADNTIVGWQAKEDVKLIIPYQITVSAETLSKERVFGLIRTIGTKACSLSTVALSQRTRLLPQNTSFLLRHG